MSEQRWGVKFHDGDEWCLEHGDKNRVAVFTTEGAAMSSAAEFARVTCAHPVKLKPRAKRELRVYAGTQYVAPDGIVLLTAGGAHLAHAIDFLDGAPEGAKVRVVVSWREP